MKVFSIIGFSKSGKTSTATNVITELKSRGYSVAAIKNIHTDQFTFKDSGDTQKFSNAKADTVMGIHKNITFQKWNKHLFLSEILRKVDADYVVIEGLKNEPLPQIVCAKNKEELIELTSEKTIAISGLISNDIEKYENLKVINAMKEIKYLVDIIEDKVFDVLPLQRKCHSCGLNCEKMTRAILMGKRKRTDCVVDAKKDLVVSVNGKELSMVAFIQDIFSDTVKSFLKNLKGFEKGDIEIKIKNK